MQQYYGSEHEQMEKMATTGEGPDYNPALPAATPARARPLSRLPGN